MRGSRPGFATVTLLFSAFLGGCSDHPTKPTDALTFTFDFHRGPQEFTAGFADYPPAREEIFSRWPCLAAVRSRFGIRGPDPGLLHPGIGHPYAPVTR